MASNRDQSHPHPPTPHGTEVSMASQEPSLQPTPSSHQQESTPTSDPVWMKWKSAVFRGAGAAQSQLGHAMGVSDLEDRGQAWEAWAARTSDQANTMTEQGAPSRLHGEYNKWMGYMGQVLGHVSGDPEMEAKGSQRTSEANNEIEKSRRSA